MIGKLLLLATRLLFTRGLASSNDLEIKMSMKHNLGELDALNQG